MGAFGETVLTANKGFQGVQLVSVGLVDVNPCFRTIPSERVGLNGEYDHGGLAKRVSHRYRQALGIEVISSLSILQRGRVVILHGRVASRELLNQLVQLAMQENGADYVELRGVVIAQ